VGVILLLVAAAGIDRRAKRRGGTVNVSKIGTSKKVGEERGYPF
jgi:hypothetical protein